MPDNRLYPEYDGLLKDAMIGETEAFFEEMLHSNLGVKTLIDSDFAMLNRRIAEHYGIPGVNGVAMRRVDLPPDSPRGGFMTQASVLKVTANGTTTSPVLRGKWIMERILGYEVPPPPVVPAVEPNDAVPADVPAPVRHANGSRRRAKVALVTTGGSCPSPDREKRWSG